MPDYRLMYDSQALFAVHLGGKDHTLRIAKVIAGEVVGEGGRKSKKPLVYFEGKELGLALCKTNARIIAGMYGNDTRKWVGQTITIYPTRTQFGKEMVDCIRVRPGAPPDAGPPPDPERDGR